MAKSSELGDEDCPLREIVERDTKAGLETRPYVGKYFVLLPVKPSVFRTTAFRFDFAESCCGIC